MVDLTDILKDMVRAREEGKQIEMTAAREVIEMAERVSPKKSEAIDALEQLVNPEEWDDESSAAKGK